MNQVTKPIYILTGLGQQVQDILHYCPKPSLFKQDSVNTCIIHAYSTTYTMTIIRCHIFTFWHTFPQTCCALYLNFIKDIMYLTFIFLVHFHGTSSCIIFVELQAQRGTDRMNNDRLGPDWIEEPDRRIRSTGSRKAVRGLCSYLVGNHQTQELVSGSFMST